MSIDRRSFFKVAGIVSASLLPDWAEARTNHSAPDFGEAYGVLVDTTVCIGCRRCELACDREHHLTDRPKYAFEDKTVLQKTRRPSATAYTVVNPSSAPAIPGEGSYVKIQCLHCNDPACVLACIVGALTKCEDGPVVYDPSKCIGCRYCLVSCPFQVPAYEYHRAIEPRVMKCNFCTHRIHEGRPPACVEACPTQALTFGKRRDLMAQARSTIALHPTSYANHIYGETEIGGTSWMYLFSEDVASIGLPELPSEPIPSRTETIQHGIFKSFLPPIGLYGLLGLIMYMTNKRQREETER